MRVLLHSQNYPSDHLRPAGVQTNPQKLPITHDPVHTPHQNSSRHPNCSLLSLALSPPSSIHPLPYSMEPFQKILPFIHLPQLYPTPKTSISPAPAAERFALFLTGDQPLHPRNLLHTPTPHVVFVVLHRSYLIMAQRRVPHQRHQISHLCPSLLSSLRTRTPSLNQHLFWTHSSRLTLGGRTSTLKPISMAKSSPDAFGFFFVG